MPPGAQIAVLAVGGALLMAALVYTAFGRSKGDAVRREQKRRLLIHERGRLTDGVVTDLQEDLIFYSYGLRGVEYTASQDISTLRDRLGPESHWLIGPVTIKYLPRNPANSIVVCEEWSGFRQIRPQITKGA